MNLKSKRAVIVRVFTGITAFAIVVALALFLLIFWLGFYGRHSEAPTSHTPPETQASPVIGQSPFITPSPKAQEAPASHDTPENRDVARPAETPVFITPETLKIPVAGIRPEQLRDTYNESRSEGRTHNALDIMAACGTPVIAALSGKIVKLFQSKRGGVTIYQMGADNRTVYYYAHLARYADGLAEGQLALQGQVIGYVGDTGNVTPGACHLHFAIWTVTDSKRYWTGENINPYPLLRSLPSLP